MARISLKTIKGCVLILRDHYNHKAFISASILKKKTRKLKMILILPTAIGMASNFSKCSHRSKIFCYGYRLWPTV